MIRLTKLDKPPILAAKEQQWTDEYLSYDGTGTMPEAARFRYRHVQIKQSIVRETREKCAYCESKVRHEQPGDIEHIRPSSKHPELVVNWENLTLACRECNRLKGDYCSDTDPMLNPYLDSAEDHIRFFGPMAIPAAGDLQGERTIKLLDLNRAPLFERRKEKLELLVNVLQRWALLPEGTDKDLLKKEIIAYACCDKEFASLVRWFLRQVGTFTDEEIRSCSPPAA